MDGIGLTSAMSGMSGMSGIVGTSVASTSAILLESGVSDHMLMEDGSFILLEF